MFRPSSAVSAIRYGTTSPGATSAKWFEAARVGIGVLAGGKVETSMPQASGVTSRGYLATFISAHARWTCASGIEDYAGSTFHP